METPTVPCIGRAVARAILVALTGTAALAATTEVSHTASLPLAFTDWVDAVFLPQADASLGTLQSVRLQVAVGLSANTVIENRDPVPRTILSTASATVSVLSAPLGAAVGATASASWSNTLEAADGVIDFDAPAGAINPSQEASAVGETILGSGLDGFLGGGVISFGVSASGNQVASGADSYVLGANILASAEVTVTYVYDDGTGGGGGGLGATLGDRVWVDLNEDGLQDDPSVEPGLVGALVTLSDANGVVASAETGADGGYQFTGIPAGTYLLTVTPPAGNNWVASADPDGILSPGAAVVTLAEGAVVPDADFGFYAVERDFPGHTGIQFWARSTDRLLAVHFDLLNGLPLVNREGAAVDFTGTLDEARSRFRQWVRRQSGRNAANRLSLELAAFALNLAQGKYPAGTVFDVKGALLSGSDVLAQATAVLALDAYTVGNDPNRRVQREWTERLAGFNGAEDDDCD